MIADFNLRSFWKKLFGRRSVQAIFDSLTAFSTGSLLRKCDILSDPFGMEADR
jgi:hypothetical protein